MITNLSEVFNNILKSVYDLLVTTILRIMFLRCNKYLIEQRVVIKEVISRDVLWPAVILFELLVEVTISITHMASLFYFSKGLFQSETPLIASVTRKVQEKIKINEPIMNQLLLVINDNYIIFKSHCMLHFMKCWICAIVWSFLLQWVV
jgi:hypothetical protein